MKGLILTYSKGIYWGGTLLFSFAIIGAGISDIVQNKDFLISTEALDYPLYFYTFLGVFKIGGVIILLTRNILPKSIVTMAYNGFVFDFTFAVLSHLSVGNILQSIFPFPFFVLLVGTNFIYRKHIFQDEVVKN